MSSKGWIKLHRKINECWIWDEKPFDKARAWIDLLLLANHSDKKILFNGNIICVKKGQYLTSIRKLSERWGWSFDKVTRFLKILVSEEMLIKESDNNRTLLTIVNYEVYQEVTNSDECTENTPSSEPSEHPQVNHPNTDRTVTSDKQELKELIKNDKNVKNKKKNTFCPPTVDEVREYLQSVGSKVDAEAFVAFYESKGWMIGKNKMKSWKMAVVTWEKKSGIKRSVPNKESTKFNPTEEEHINLWDEE